MQTAWPFYMMLALWLPIRCLKKLFNKEVVLNLFNKKVIWLWKWKLNVPPSSTLGWIRTFLENTHTYGIHVVDMCVSDKMSIHAAIHSQYLVKRGCFWWYLHFSRSALPFLNLHWKLNSHAYSWNLMFALSRKYIIMISLPSQCYRRNTSFMDHFKDKTSTILNIVWVAQNSPFVP